MIASSAPSTRGSCFPAHLLTLFSHACVSGSALASRQGSSLPLFSHLEQQSPQDGAGQPALPASLAFSHSLVFPARSLRSLQSRLASLAHSHRQADTYKRTATARVDFDRLNLRGDRDVEGAKERMMRRKVEGGILDGAISPSEQELRQQHVPRSPGFTILRKEREREEAGKRERRRRATAGEKSGHQGAREEREAVRERPREREREKE